MAVLQAAEPSLTIYNQNFAVVRDSVPVELHRIPSWLTGEDTISYTSRDEKIRVFTGSAFDLTGERKRTSFRNDVGRQQMDETFEIVLRNHKNEPVEIRMFEHLYRWNTWEIQSPSMPFSKSDSDTIEFRVNVPASGEQKVSYNAHYTW